MDDIVYIPKSIVIEQHDYIIDKSGGSNGIYSEKDGLLDSILEHIQNDDYFPSFLDKLTKLLIGIAEYHIFIDGKRKGSRCLEHQAHSAAQHVLLHGLYLLPVQQNFSRYKRAPFLCQQSIHTPQQRGFSAPRRTDNSRNPVGRYV